MSSGYVWPLPDGFPMGSRATIRGIPKVDAADQIFAVNLLAKVPHDGKGDYVYHAAFHYGAQYLVNNTYLIKKGWQEKKRYDLALDAGKLFEINILHEATHFSLYVNGKHIGDFHHRTPVGDIRCLTVEASVEVFFISVDKIKSINWPLRNDFQITDTIVITGSPGFYNSSGKFDIRFQNSPAHDKPDDVPFSMTVRFLERKIINNTYVPKDWGREESHNLESPLVPGKEFEIAISHRGSNFKVFVNDEQPYEYKMRIPPDRIKYLVIAGDVNVSSIDYVVSEVMPRQIGFSQN